MGQGAVLLGFDLKPFRDSINTSSQGTKTVTSVAQTSQTRRSEINPRPKGEQVKKDQQRESQAESQIPSLLACHILVPYKTEPPPLTPLFSSIHHAGCHHHSNPASLKLSFKKMIPILFFVLAALQPASAQSCSQAVPSPLNKTD